MSRIFFVLVLLMMGNGAQAQYKGPALQACSDYALKELRRDGMNAKAVLIERDADLSFEREARKIGGQPLGAILSGNGAVVYEAAPSAELSFLCLLADEKRPVFFAWQPRPNAPALSQCVRSEALKSGVKDCLALLQRVAEQDLAELYALRFQEANERGERTLAAYRQSNEEWLQYRAAECARRGGLAPSGVSSDVYQAACMVELTRRRALDMRAQ